jgi:uncharacterized iron-regulated protein
MKVSVALAFFAGIVISQSACAQVEYDGHTGAVIKDETFYGSLAAGTVLIVSEIHTSAKHHEVQRQVLEKLAATSYPKSVGMEFFYYPQQDQVNDYVTDKIDEATFLNAINWSKKTPFEFYRYQVRFPATHGGDTVALNMPMAITGKVKDVGIEGLNEEERKLLPPNFELGADSYLKRFREVMKDHAPEDKILKYFAAQSLWDDTMAWKASEYMKSHSDHLLVIIVGDFHVAYQDGLVARLRKRGVQKIVSVSQVDTYGMSDTERRATIAPDEVYGVRADFVFDSH